MPRSWTDLASNVTHIEGLALDQHLEQLLRPGTAPEDLLLSSLHEFTHHWCFFSALGLAATCLDWRMAHSILMDDDERRDSQILRDYVVRHTLTSALRPLNEGMALFAEFDAMSLRSTTLSPPLRSVISFFSGRAPSTMRLGGFDELDATSASEHELLAVSLPVLTTLRELRAGETGARRKTIVLATPLCKDSDGYPTGYIAVRGLGKILRQRVKRLYYETDLALSYLRAFFYDDMRLVEYVLDEDESPERLANGIVQRLYQRTDELWEVTEEDVDRFEESMLSGLAIEDPSWAIPLHLSPSEWSRGMAARDRLTTSLTTASEQRLMSDDTDAQMAQGLSLAFLKMLQRRHIVHLGSQSADVDVGADGKFEVRVRNTSVLTGAALAGVPAQKGTGTIELIFSQLSHGIARGVVVHGPKTVVDIVTPGRSIDSAERQLLLDAVRPRDDALRLSDLCDALIEAYLVEAGMRPLIELMTAGLTYAVAHVWLDSGLTQVDTERREEVTEILKSSGIYGLLGYDRDLLDALPILGALAPTMPFNMMLAHELERRGFENPNLIFEGLLACGENTGFPILKSDGVQSLVQI